MGYYGKKVVKGIVDSCGVGGRRNGWMEIGGWVLWDECVGGLGEFWWYFVWWLRMIWFLGLIGLVDFDNYFL